MPTTHTVRPTHREILDLFDSLLSETVVEPRFSQYVDQAYQALTKSHRVRIDCELTTTGNFEILETANPLDEIWEII